MILKEKGYDYICISRSALKEYAPVENTSPIKITDNRNHPIEIQLINSSDPEQTDIFLCVKSEQKQIKEESIYKKLSTRYEQYLETIRSSLSKKHGVKTEEKVNRRIGWATEKYPSISQLYDISLEVSENKTVIAMTWQRNEKKKQTGVYFVRCSARELTEMAMWEFTTLYVKLKALFAA